MQKRKRECLCAGLICISVMTGCSKATVGNESSKETKASEAAVVQVTQAPVSTVAPAKYNFSFNPYIIFKDCVQKYGEEYTTFFKGFVDAYMNYETSCPCPNEKYANDFFDVVDGMLPVFYADASLDYDTCYSKKDKTLTWSYRSKNKKEHDKIIEDFKDIISKYMECLQEKDSEFEKALALYQELTTHTTFDDKFINPSVSDITTYHVFKKGLGICQGISRAYAYLLVQAGIDGEVVVGQSDSVGSHSWNVATIDGKQYLFDPTFEVGWNGTAGKGLKYFGMSNETRESKYGGKLLLKQSRYGLCFDLKAKDYMKISKDRDLFKNCTKYDWDREKGCITYYIKGDTTAHTYQYK